MSTYSELLKHPEWQRKRLEVLQAADFTCENCGVNDITLHVHHGYYERGRAPWEYPTETLHCLCEQCHADFQSVLTQVQRVLAECSLSDLCTVYGFALGVRAAPGGFAEDCTSVKDTLAPAEAVMGLALAYGADDRRIIKHLQQGKALKVADVLAYRKAEAR